MTLSKTLILAILSNLIFRQVLSQVNYEWYWSESNGGLCSRSIMLFNDSTYCAESGCEASSHFSFGIWKLKSNRYTFIPADLKKYEFISKIEREITPDKNLTVMIFDKFGKNITDRVTAQQYVKNLGLYSLDLDSTGSKRSDYWRKNSFVVLNSFQVLFKRKLEIPTDSANLVKIYLNVSSQWNFHIDSDWNNTGTFHLVKKGSKLVSNIPDHIDSNGNLQYMELTKQTK